MPRPRLGSFLARWGTRGLLLGLVGCVQPYAPDVVEAPTSYLVVDGFINGNGVTTVLLSHTANLAATASPAVEKGAKLFVVDNTGQRYALVEKVSGTYKSDSLLLDPSRQYQLRFTTSSSAAYESALVPLKVTPPIDKLDWKIDNKLLVTLSTHDPSAQSHYYRWGFVETWEFHSAFESTIEYDYKLRKVVPRTTPIYTCWQTQQSSTIQQGSSAQLSQDALTNVPILAISTRAERLAVRYSVLISQVAETAEEFAYYDLLRKNTEAVGGVNDPLPVQLTGNMHRINNPAEPVLGFVGAHTVQRQRVFINRQDLPFPRTWQFESPYLRCTMDTVTTELVSNPGNVPISYRMGDTFLGSTRECVDCRVRGSNVKPSFW